MEVLLGAEFPTWNNPAFLSKLSFLLDFHEKMGPFVNFLCNFPFYKLFLKSKRVLLLFSKRNLQISLVRGQGERSRRHAVFTGCLGLLYRLLAGLWSHRPRATALLGRGSFAFIVQGLAEPRLGKCNDSRLFCIHTKFWHSFLQNKANSVGENYGGRYGREYDKKYGT